MTIEEKVNEKYPITQKELSCKYEKHKRDWLRLQYKNELIEQEKNSKQEHDNQPKV